MNKTYYLLNVTIDQDSDFYIEHYKNLEFDDTILFNHLTNAIDTVKKHLKLAIDTFRTTKGVDYVKDAMEEIYNDPLTWEVEDSDDYEYILYIDRDLGNYSIKYTIKRVEVID